MRTNVVLNDELIQKALFLVPSVKTKKDIIDLALREFIEVREAKKIQELRGMELFADDYDYKKMRTKNNGFN